MLRRAPAPAAPGGGVHECIGQARVNALVITGPGGFIGRGLMAALPAGDFDEVRILVHRQHPPEVPAAIRVKTVTGDLLEPGSLRELVAPGATVVHLASPLQAEENIAAARNLLAACREAGVARLVHCSTAVVVGNVPDDVITEETTCHPFTEYERAKYRIEQEARAAAAGRHEIAILRPTSVFGPGGRNLLSLARRVSSGSETVNRAYSILHGRRRMNLVSVHNVAAALSFLATTQQAIDQQTYIASDDEAPANNFQDIEQILRREFGRERSVPAWSMPAVLLSAALRARGRSNTNPERIYSDAKLRALGFVKPWVFDQAVIDFARWFRVSGPTGVHAGT
jgi:nucleoside-diphosphate-sugar epimerase